MATLTFHGHAACEIVLAGKRVWVDPFLTGNPQATVQASAVAADVIAITHGHNDHFGDAIDICKRTGAVLVGSWEVCCHAQKHGVQHVEPGNHGGTVKAAGVSFTFTPAWHSSSLDVGGQALYMGNPAGFVIAGGGKRVYHMGDTGLFGDIKLIAERCGPFDVALIPTGDRFTMGLDDAVLVAQWLQARVAVPIHHGTFPTMIESNGAAFAQRLTSAGIAGRCLGAGEMMEF